MGGWAWIVGCGQLSVDGLVQGWELMAGSLCQQLGVYWSLVSQRLGVNDWVDYLECTTGIGQLGVDNLECLEWTSYVP